MTSSHDDKMDPKPQVDTYTAIMRFTGFIGIPLSIGLTVFFAALAARHGWMAPVYAVLAGMASRILFKIFFKS